MKSDVRGEFNAAHNGERSESGSRRLRMLGLVMCRHPFLLTKRMLSNQIAPYPLIKKQLFG